MKKYRVIKEFPFAKVGDVLDMLNDTLSLKSLSDYLVIYYKEEIEQMIKEGWIEEIIEEKEANTGYSSEIFYPEDTRTNSEKLDEVLERLDKLENKIDMKWEK